MPFPFLTITEIVDDFFQSLKDSGSRLGNAQEGSRIYFIARAIGAVVSKGYSALQIIASEFYVATSAGQSLRRRVQDFNMIPDPGELAAGAVIAVAPVGQIATLTAGETLYASDRSIQFEVLQDAVLGSLPTHIPVIAREVGSKHNLPAGAPLSSDRAELKGASILVSYNPPVNGLPDGPMRGGRAAETDEEIRARFPLHLKSFARGVGYAVLAALKNVPGLRVVNLRNADPVPGYFTIVTGNDANELTPELRAGTNLMLEQWAALGYGFEFETLERRPVAIEVRVTVNDRTVGLAVYESQVAQAVTDSITRMIQGESLYRSEIIRAGKVPGVVNIEVLKPTTDVIVSASEVVIAESVVVRADYQ